jgi:hypothetical protein
MTTLNAFAEAAKSTRAAARAWVDQLAQISENDVIRIFDQIPRDRISDAAQQFAMKMLELNKRRLIDLRV